MAKAKLRIENKRTDSASDSLDSLALIRGSEAATGGPADLAFLVVQQAGFMFLNAEELRSLSVAAAELADDLEGK
jgi:hypothetical protein